VAPDEVTAGRPRRVADDISVALCTFNGEKFIVEQLESILRQTLRPRELVISDDGSTDRTLEVVRRVLTPELLAETGISLKLLQRKEPLGVTRNFEAALTACSGEFVSLCDQDDVWRPDRLERLRAEFSSDDVLLVHSDARMVDSAGRPLGHSLFSALGAGRRELAREQGPTAFEVLVRRNLVTGATAMVRRQLLVAARPFPASWVHDHWLAVVASLAGRIVVDQGLLIDYRQHGANQIGATKLNGSVALDLLAQSRRRRHEERVERISELNHRLIAGELSATAAQRAFVAGKLRHELIRRGMPRGRIARWPSVARELVTGRYHRFSRGVIDVVRDALSVS
jgi:glycosyltransferase involved in cell wall biosynthesis